MRSLLNGLFYWVAGAWARNVHQVHRNVLRCVLAFALDHHATPLIGARAASSWPAGAEATRVAGRCPAGGPPRQGGLLGGAMDHAVLDGAALARFSVTLQRKIAAAEGLR